MHASLRPATFRDENSHPYFFPTSGAALQESEQLAWLEEETDQVGREREDLGEAGVISRTALKGLISLTALERQLASDNGDIRTSKPVRRVPHRPRAH